jgi:hypothetical protein
MTQARSTISEMHESVSNSTSEERRRSLEFYLRPAMMTDPGADAGAFDELPPDIGSLVRTVQDLLVHEHLTSAYGLELLDERRRESQIRPVARMLRSLLARDSRPLSVARPVDERLVGVCRHFAVLLVSILRAKGVPARARCGFGAYFFPGRYEDHWVCEYWNSGRQRWILVDAQIDAVQRDIFKPAFDLLDVPRDQFLVAGEAWARCREGEADPQAFGIFDMRGPAEIAQNLLRDFAAANNMEMLPWDVWGAMPRGSLPSGADLELFDRVAALTRKPDSGFDEISRRYSESDRLRVPASVFNGLLRRDEAV